MGRKRGGFVGQIQKKIDKELVEKIHSSSQEKERKEAFNALFMRHKDFVYRFLRSDRPRHADDLFQVTWVHLQENDYKELTYEGKSRFTTWLVFVIKTRIYDIYFNIKDAKVKLKLEDTIPVDIRPHTLRHLFIKVIPASVKVRSVLGGREYKVGKDYELGRENLEICRAEDSSIPNRVEVEVRYRYTVPVVTLPPEGPREEGEQRGEQQEESKLSLPLSGMLSENGENLLDKIIDKIDTEEQMKVLRKCMDELSRREKEEIDRPKYYQVMFLTYIQGEENKDIASFLAIKRNTKDTWLRRAKKTLLGCFVFKFHGRKR